MKNLQVRIDAKLRARAEKVFKKIGIDTPTAIRIFFSKVVNTDGLPFVLQVDDDHYTPAQLRAIDREARLAKQGKGLRGPFSSVEEMLKDLHR